MKRFVDTDLWKKQWFMELTPAEKIAWLYITSECDNVGVWSPNYRLAEFIIGTQLDWEKFRLKCNNNIIIIQSGKWWLIDFIKFQYGELKETCKPHLSYIKLLKAHGLFKIYNQTHSIGYPYPMDTLKDQYKDKDKDKDKDQDQDKEIKESKDIVDKSTDNVYFSLFAKWNSTKGLRHSKESMFDEYVKSKHKKLIDATGIPEVEKAIKNYAIVLSSDDYWFTYSWPFWDFISRGLSKFIDEAKPLENFCTKKVFKFENEDYDDIKKSMYKGMGE